MTMELSPEVDLLTCHALGMVKYPIPVSTSNHILVDLANLKHTPDELNSSFLADELEYCCRHTPITRSNSAAYSVEIRLDSPNHAA